MSISVFKTALDTNPEVNISFYTFLGYVKDGRWQDEVLAVRLGKKDKKTMPAVTPSGTFSKRRADSLQQHSNILCVDIDFKDNEDADIEALKNDPYTWAVHRSVGGLGWVAYFRIDGSKHLEAYLGLEKYLADYYKVIADKSCKDVSRLRIVSWDPDLYQKDHEPKQFKLYIKDKTQEIERKPVIATNEDYKHIIKQIQDKKIDLTNNSHHDWIQIGYSLANGLGEQGRELYHAVSSISPKYDELQTDAKYNLLLKNKNGSVSLNTFFYLCSQAGIETQTDTTRKIINLTQLAKSRDSQNAEQAKASTLKLLEQQGIKGSEIVATVDKAFDLDIKTKKAQKSSGEIESIKLMLKSYDLRFNLVTQNMEIDGRNFTDREFNNIFIQLREQLGNTVQSQIVNSIIDSDNTQSFNPFTEYLQECRDIKTSGHITRLCEAIQYKESKYMSQATLEHYVKKWLLGIIASMHGTHSVTILVLCGGQGIGKTNFFRKLLPEKLRSYYAESKLDLGKDDLILMCNKLIICDDEFGGKSKKEEKLLKELSSKQIFSVRPPYQKRNIDMQRYAVLCGTSNDSQLLNDLTGNRRIIPIDITGIDWDLYNSIDKDLLFAELYHEFLSCGKDWQLNSVDIAILNELTYANRSICIEEELLIQYFKEPEAKHSEWLTNTQILNIISQDTNQRLTSHKLGQVLKNYGYRKEYKSINGKTSGVWWVCKRNDLEPTFTITDITDIM
jgi:predicted P-loop ATPase